MATILGAGGALDTLQIPTSPLRNDESQPLEQIVGPLLLALVAVVIHGYHPYAEDAAIYIPAVKKQLDPSLYPQNSRFFLSHAHFSLFANLVSRTASVSHISLAYILFGFYCTSVLLVLLASWRICELCLGTRTAACMGVLVMASALTVPVAGTSLLLADPYLTARSLSFPVLLFAIGAVLDHKDVRAAIWLLCAILLHPLMAVYGVVFVFTLWASMRQRWKLLGIAGLLMLTMVIVACIVSSHLAVSSSYREAVSTRPYLFVNGWAWYEVAGAIAPMLLFACLLRARRHSGLNRLSSCALAAILNGTFFLLAALLIATTPARLVLARFQPMRADHLLYAMMLLLPVNMGLQGIGKRASRILPPVLLLAAFAINCCVQLAAFPASPHIEWPWSHPVNPWRQAFAWVRRNTPKDAVFALPPDYMDEPGEDRLGFRAFAERASLADRSKDAGVVVIFPWLAQEWHDQVLEADSLTRASKPPLGMPAGNVGWIVRPRGNADAAKCPFVNSVVAVCPAPSQPLPERLYSLKHLYSNVTH